MKLTNRDPQKLVIITLVLIMALGLGLRLYQLGARDVWLDEAYSLEVAGFDGVTGVIKRTTTDTHPPLYYIFLYYWLTFGESEFFIRLPSILFNVATIFGVYLLGAYIFNKKAALFAALLASVSPFQVFYSQEARMYPLLAVTAVFSLYFYIRALEEDQLSYWLAWALLAIASLYTHYYGLYLLPIYGLYFVFSWPGSKPSLKTFTFLYIVIILTFIPWVPTLIRQIERGGRYWLGLPNMMGIMRTLRYYLLNNYTAAYLDGLLPFFYTLTLFFLVLHQRAKVWGKGLLIVLYFVIPVFMSYLVTKHLTPVFAYKYLIMSAPAFYILLGGAFFPGDDFKPGHYLIRISKCFRLLAIGFTVFILILSLQHYLAKESGESVQEWRRSIAYVNDVVAFDDAVVINAWWMYMPFQYYYNGDAPWFALPLENAADLERLLADKKRVALVLSHDRGYDPEGIILEHLQEFYEIIEAQEFRGVRIVLMEAKSDQK